MFRAPTTPIPAPRRHTLVPRRGLRSVAVLLCVLVLVVLPRTVLASAPMCDPSGASVSAPIPAPPSATGDLFPSGRCGTALHAGDASRGGQERPAPDQGWERHPDRVVPTGYSFAPLEAERQNIERSLLPALPPGFGQGVYRPPRG